MAKIESFRDLEVWQHAHELTLLVYRITKDFPSEEKFGLVSQMRRAAVSVAANIAEGFKRQGKPDKVHFYNISEASLEELKYYFIPSQDLGLIPSSDEYLSQSDIVSKMLYRLIERIKTTCSRQ